MSEANDPSHDTGGIPQNLEDTVDPSLTGDQYLGQVKQLSITLPRNDERSWKDGTKWSHPGIPSAISDQIPTYVSRDKLDEIDVLGKAEADILFQDLEIVVQKIWGTWENMHVAYDKRKPKRESFGEALLSLMWPVWKRAAGFPENHALKVWLTRYLKSRIASKRNTWLTGLGSIKKNSELTSANDQAASQLGNPDPDSFDPDHLFPLVFMNISFSRSSAWHGLQDPPQDQAAGTIDLTVMSMAMVTNNASSTASEILDLLKTRADWDPDVEFLRLLNSNGGVHCDMTGESRQGILLRALLAEHQKGEKSLKICIVPLALNPDLGSGSDDKNRDRRPPKITIQYLQDLLSDPEKVAQGRVVLLTGMPGTGKLGIAQAITDGTPKETTRIIDDLPIVRAAETIVPDHRVDAHMTLRQDVRRVMFDALTQQMMRQQVLTAVMVECLSDTEEHIQMLVEHVHIARDADVPFYHIEVKCDAKEHENRVRNHPRPESERFQPEDADDLREFANNYRHVDPRKLPTELLNQVEMYYYTLDATD